MSPKFIQIFILVSVVELLIVNGAQANLSVGVKKGDWIEYAVTTSGSPPEQFNVTWARMQILNVEGPIIVTNVTTRAANGTVSSIQMTLNLLKGQVGAWFIIPANLKPGDSFLDASTNQRVIIQGEQQLTWAGDIRSITNASTPQRIKLWDKSTGVFVQCIDVLDNYTINATAIRTNMWGKQNSLPATIVNSRFLFIAMGISIVTIGIGMLNWKQKRAKAPTIG